MNNDWQSPCGKARVLCGDAKTRLAELEDGSVQCCVTSPPYWGLHDYKADGQIGLERTPEEYVSKMVQLFREVRRVLRDDGTLWLNLGDSYAGSGKGGNPDAGKQATNFSYDFPCRVNTPDAYCPCSMLVESQPRQRNVGRHSNYDFDRSESREGHVPVKRFQLSGSFSLAIAVKKTAMALGNPPREMHQARKKRTFKW